MPSLTTPAHAVGRRPRRSGVLIAIAAVSGIVALQAPAARAADPPAGPTLVASVDFARPAAGHSVVGFLHGLGPLQPPDRFIVPLRPTLWRGSLFSAPYDRASRLGARYMLVVSDLWGYPGQDWYGRSAPWTDWAKWSAFVRDLAAANRGRNLIWDIWNEPDNPYFWTGTEAQLHELYRVAYVAIRRTLGPQAIIAGPSVSAFRWGWLTRLLEFCRSADCEVDALTWHELPGGRGVASIADHARRARTWLLHNPAYAALGLRELDVGEYVGEGDALYAGELLGYLAQLERAGITRAAHACWPDPSGADTCRGQTLDGLLDATTMRPRAPWWALSWYVRGAHSRVRGSSPDPALAVAASRATAPGRAQIVLGYLDTHDRPLPPTTDVVLRVTGLDRLRFLRRGRQPRISAYVVHSQGEAPTRPVPTPLPAIDQATADGLVLHVHDLGLHDALLLQLSRS